MDQEIQLTENKIKELQVTNLTRRTLSILVSNDYAGKAAMVKHFTKSNSPKFEELLKVPERIPDLAAKIGLSDMGKILMVEITKFINCYTIIRPMNADQIAQCAFAIISTAEEDYLSLPDIIVFFEGAKQGKYGRVLDHIDQHVIFEMLEVYRQERHVALLNIKSEREAQYSTSRTALGRSSDDRKATEESMRKVLADYYGKSVISQNEK